MKSELLVEGKEIKNGVSIRLGGKEYKIEYQGEIWKKTPPSIRKVLLENLTFGFTHFLGLILNKEKIKYNIKIPIFESFLFKNQLYDLLSCEKADRVSHLFYLRSFYNQEFEFERGEISLPNPKEMPDLSPRKAIIPFSFGKESLTTLGLCLELGIEPILVYCQEPAHPYEEKYKLKKLKEIKGKFKIKTYFIKNEPGLFRYGIAFGKKKKTEIGWGSQTTLLAFLSLPFVFSERAGLILFGNEYSNNEIEWKEGWKVFLSFDQTSSWTRQQDIMIGLLTNGNCHVKSSLEPLEEIQIFYLLHHRYPELGKYQFSCSAQKPLLKGSQWCHHCYKCARMFLFALCCEIDPYKIGFKKNLLRERGLFSHYFGKKAATGSIQELDFCFYWLYKKKFKSPLMKIFEKERLPKLKTWNWYRNYYSSLHPAENLPPDYEEKIKAIFEEEIKKFSQLLPK
jgi:hypothetical protein